MAHLSTVTFYHICYFYKTLIEPKTDKDDSESKKELDHS